MSNEENKRLFQGNENGSKRVEVLLIVNSQLSPRRDHHGSPLALPSPNASTPPRQTSRSWWDRMRSPMSALEMTQWFTSCHPEATLELASAHSRGLEWLADEGAVGLPRLYYRAEGLQAWLVKGPSEVLVFRPGNAYVHSSNGNVEVSVDRNDLVELQLQLWPERPPPLAVDWFRKLHPEASVGMAQDDVVHQLDAVADQSGIGSPRAYHLAEGAHPLDNALLVSGPTSCLAVGPNSAFLHTLQGDFQPVADPQELQAIQRRLWPKASPVPCPSGTALPPSPAPKPTVSIAVAKASPRLLPATAAAQRPPSTRPTVGAPSSASRMIPAGLEWFAREYARHSLIEREPPTVLTAVAEAAGIHGPRVFYQATLHDVWRPQLDIWLLVSPTKSLLVEATRAHTRTNLGELAEFECDELTLLRTELWDPDQLFRRRFLHQADTTWLDLVNGNEYHAADLPSFDRAEVPEDRDALHSLAQIPDRPADGAPFAEFSLWLQSITGPLQPAESNANVFQPRFEQITRVRGPLMREVAARYPDAEILPCAPQLLWIQAAQSYNIVDPLCYRLARPASLERFRNDVLCLCGTNVVFLQSMDGCALLSIDGSAQVMPHSTHPDLLASHWSQASWIEYLGTKIIPLTSGFYYDLQSGQQWTDKDLRSVFSQAQCFEIRGGVLQGHNPIDAWLLTNPRRYSEVVVDPRPSTGSAFHRFDPWTLIARPLTLLPDLSFFYEVVCDYRPLALLFLLYWVKQIREHPAIANKVALVFYGLSGVGKSVAASILCQLIAPHADVLRNSDFNALQTGTLLICSENVVVPTSKAHAARLRAQIGRGETDVFVANNFIFVTSNDDALKLMPDDKFAHFPFSDRARGKEDFGALQSRWQRSDCQRTLDLIARLPPLANRNPPQDLRLPPAFLFKVFPQLGFFAWLLRGPLLLKVKSENGADPLLPIWHAQGAGVCHLDQFGAALAQRETEYRQNKEMPSLGLDGKLGTYCGLLSQIFHPEAVEVKPTVAEANAALVAFTKDVEDGYKVHFKPLQELQIAFALRIGQPNYFQA